MRGKEGKPASPEEMKAFYYSGMYRKGCVDIEKLKEELKTPEIYCGY